MIFQAKSSPYGPIRNADAHVRVSASIVVLDRVPPRKYKFFIALTCFRMQFPQLEKANKAQHFEDKMSPGTPSTSAWTIDRFATMDVQPRGNKANPLHIHESGN